MFKNLSELRPPKIDRATLNFIILILCIIALAYIGLK